MPHLDIIDSIEEKRGIILRMVRAYTKDEDNTGPLSMVVDDALSDIADHVNEEREEWERTLTLIQDEDRDYEDYVI